MKAKDLTQADVGKWVTLRMMVTEQSIAGEKHRTEFLGHPLTFMDDRYSVFMSKHCTLEFTTPPPPVQEVGDVFRFLSGGKDNEWTIAAIDGDACLLRYFTHTSARYPLNPDLWEFVRKGTVA